MARCKMYAHFWTVISKHRGSTNDLVGCFEFLMPNIRAKIFSLFFSSLLSHLILTESDRLVRRGMMWIPDYYCAQEWEEIDATPFFVGKWCLTLEMKLKHCAFFSISHLTQHLLQQKNASKPLFAAQTYSACHHGWQCNRSCYLLLLFSSRTVALPFKVVRSVQGGIILHGPQARGETFKKKRILFLSTDVRARFIARFFFFSRKRSIVKYVSPEQFFSWKKKMSGTGAMSERTAGHMCDLWIEGERNS